MAGLRCETIILMTPLVVHLTLLIKKEEMVIHSHTMESYTILILEMEVTIEQIKITEKK